MQLTTALAIFRALEEQRETEFEGDPPTYDVRLDATSATDGGIAPGPAERYHRVRVTAAKLSAFTRDSLLYVLEVAGEHKVEMIDVANNGIELY